MMLRTAVVPARWGKRGGVCLLVVGLVCITLAIRLLRRGEEGDTGSAASSTQSSSWCEELVAATDDENKSLDWWRGGSARQVCQDLLKVATQAAGVYTRPKDRHAMSKSHVADDVLEKTVILHSFNAPYIPFFVNWECMLPVGGQFKSLVFAQTAKTQTELQGLIKQAEYEFPKESRRFFIFHDSLLSRADDSEAPFKSEAFNRIAVTKLRVALLLLSLGFNVIFSDADVVWLDDPLRYMPTDADFVAQTASGGQDRIPRDWEVDSEGFSTGFYFAKANHRTIALFRETVLKAVKDNYQGNDQTYLRAQLILTVKGGLAEYWGSKSPMGSMTQRDLMLSFRMLEPALFLIGFPDIDSAMQKDRIELWKVKDLINNYRDRPVVFHASFALKLKAKKEKLFMNALWKDKCTDLICECAPRSRNIGELHK